MGYRYAISHARAEDKLALAYRFEHRIYLSRRPSISNKLQKLAEYVRLVAACQRDLDTTGTEQLRKEQARTWSGRMLNLPNCESHGKEPP